MISDAHKPWSPCTHYLSSSFSRRLVFVVLLVARRLELEGLNGTQIVVIPSDGPQPLALPKDVWFVVLSYLPRGD